MKLDKDLLEQYKVEHFYSDAVERRSWSRGMEAYKSGQAPIRIWEKK